MTPLVSPTTSLLFLSSWRTRIIKFLSSGLILDPFLPGSSSFCYSNAKILALLIAEAQKSVLSGLKLIMLALLFLKSCVPFPLLVLLGRKSFQEGFFCDCVYSFTCVLHVGMTLCSVIISISPNQTPGLFLQYFFSDLLLSFTFWKLLFSGMLVLVCLVMLLSIVTDATIILPVIQSFSSVSCLQIPSL